jgi:hypothetical protein
VNIEAADIFNEAITAWIKEHRHAPDHN